MATRPGVLIYLFAHGHWERYRRTCEALTIGISLNSSVLCGSSNGFALIRTMLEGRLIGRQHAWGQGSRRTNSRPSGFGVTALPVAGPGGQLWGVVAAGAPAVVRWCHLVGLPGTASLSTAASAKSGSLAFFRPQQQRPGRHAYHPGAGWAPHQAAPVLEPAEPQPAAPHEGAAEPALQFLLAQGGFDSGSGQPSSGPAMATPPLFITSGANFSKHGKATRLLRGAPFTRTSVVVKGTH
jgi:hypothetical protein